MMCGLFSARRTIELKTEYDLCYIYHHTSLGVTHFWIITKLKNESAARCLCHCIMFDIWFDRLHDEHVCNARRYIFHFFNFRRLISFIIYVRNASFIFLFSLLPYHRILYFYNKQYGPRQLYDKYSLKLEPRIYILLNPFPCIYL